jgi:hypothetical protein
MMREREKEKEIERKMRDYGIDRSIVRDRWTDRERETVSRHSLVAIEDCGREKEREEERKRDF